MVNTVIRFIIFFSAKDGEALYSQQKHDWELTVAQIMNSLLPNSNLNWKKVRKTARPFGYDLNQIPYDYTVKVTNRFKGLDMRERESAWRTMDEGSWLCTGDRNQDNPQEKEMHKGKMIVWGGLTNSCETKRSERQRRKGKIHPFECRVPNNSKER